LHRERDEELTELVVVAGVLVGVGLLRLLLLEEVGVGDGREGSGLVDNRSLVDLLVDGLSVVDSGGLDSLSLDDGLDCGLACATTNGIITTC
jgi:hypothetical protein